MWLLLSYNEALIDSNKEGLGMLKLILGELGLDKEQITAFEALLKITACTESLQRSFESPLDALNCLVATTQAHWLRKAGTERWDQEDTPTIISKRELFLELFNQLGLLAEKKPVLKNYDYVLLLGGLQVRVENRLDYLASLWEQGIRFKQLVLLGGKRLLIDEESITRTLKEGATELDMMESLVKARQLNWPIGLSEVEVVSVNAPQVAGKRPTTKDTINTWRSKKPQPGNTLAISNQPHLRYQNAVIKNCLPVSFRLETVGSSVDKNEKVTLMLDTLARFIYAEVPRLEASYTQEVNCPVSTARRNSR